MEKVVFLGGSCGDTTWRNKLIPKLESVGVKYFNPVVEDWNEEAQKAEDDAIIESDTLLFLLSPRTNSMYSLFEIGAFAFSGRKLIFTYLDEDHDEDIYKITDEYTYLHTEKYKAYSTHELKALRKIVSDLRHLKNVLVIESIFSEGVENEIKRFVDVDMSTLLSDMYHE